MIKPHVSKCDKCKHRAKPKIRVEQYGDGFAIFLLDKNDESYKTYSFNQEDTVEKLKDLFISLGFKAEYDGSC